MPLRLDASMVAMETMIPVNPALSSQTSALPERLYVFYVKEESRIHMMQHREANYAHKPRRQESDSSHWDHRNSAKRQARLLFITSTVDR